MNRRLSSEKIKPASEIRSAVLELKHSSQKVVLTNGCFDLIHPGHVRYLNQARSHGDLLLVALNSDASVRRLKGAGRPILSEEDRCEMVASLECVDLVTVFEEETPARLIQDLLPDVLVKGGDWALDEIVGGTEVEAAGGEVISIPFEKGYSTTSLIEQIRHSS